MSTKSRPGPSADPALDPASNQPNKYRGQYITFGIPSLDELLGRPTSSTDLPEAEGKFGLYLDNCNQSTSLCLIGPDGTGKSVLALHLAAQYAATCDDDTRILYASTDLSFGKTLTTWVNFALALPHARRAALKEIIPPGRVEYDDEDDDKEPKTRVWIERYLPLIPAEGPVRVRGENDYDHIDGRPLPGYLIESPRRKRPVRVRVENDGKKTEETQTETRHYVGFIDLESSTAGDDWGLINRLLASLKAPRKDNHRHLLIIDAVEGLEAFGGHEDAFGHLRERRSRIAQVLRAAKDKCHVVFVVEEPRDNERLPEQFVSDVVIRLRVERSNHGYSRRTLEIEKQRGQAYVRGRHDCMIRRGFGSQTGMGDTKPNPDDKPYKVAGIIPVNSEVAALAETKSYFLVLPSLHYISRELMEAQGLKPSPDRRLNRIKNLEPGFCGFGITYLDDMLGDQGRTASDPPGFDLGNASDSKGFPWGSVSSLIGDEGTHKSRVGRAFLAQAFRHEDGTIDPKRGVALLLTTHDLDAQRLVQKFASHHGTEEKSEPEIEKRAFCRRIEYHHLTPAELFHIVSSLVEEGLEALRKSDLGDVRYDKVDPVNPGRVRLVIDDWSGLRDAHHEIRDDPLFLPFLLFYLRRRGVTVLLIDTQPGRPNHILVDESDRVLRALVDHHVYTWHVTFFGAKRVAISALPPVDDTQRVIVRELRPDSGNSEALEVDPSFELYNGFEDDQAPTLIPLKVDLFAADRALSAYHEDIAATFRAVFDGNAEVKWSGARSWKFGVKTIDYDQLRSQIYLSRHALIEHTQVLQVDEFWSDEGRTLENLSGYLKAPVVLSNGDPNLFEDPGQLFQATVAMAVEYSQDDRERLQKAERRKQFQIIGYQLDREQSPCDRVPYLLDFGFLLARSDRWRDAIKKLGEKEEKESKDKAARIQEVWEALADHPRPRNHFEIAYNPVKVISWRDFLVTCMDVASATDLEDHDPVFDVDLSTVESLSCLALEIIASELHLMGQKDSDAEELSKALFPRHRHDPVGPGLGGRSSQSQQPGLVGPPSDPDQPLATPGRIAIFRAWLLLVSTLKGRLPRERFELKPRTASTNAIASRHWYSTACPASQEQPELTPLRLPGNFSVRGDWFLAIGAGSRSHRLGERAIDVLTSRRANITRMQLGLGLPVRGFSETKRLASTWEDTEFRSPLTFNFGADGSKRRHLFLHDLLRLGGSPSDFRAFDFDVEDAEFFWLWRSRLKDYDRHSRIWRKWLLYAIDSVNNDEFPEFASLKNSKECLDLYDKVGLDGKIPRQKIAKTEAIANLEEKEIANAESIVKAFDRLCEILRVALERATIRDEPT